MSSQRGNSLKKGPPKYQNKTAFKNNLHDASPKTKMLNQLVIEGCCQRCKDVLDWKIKFKKYKVLSQPRKCIKCSQKRVTSSYFIICSACSEKDHSCGKCGGPMQADEKITAPGDAPTKEKEQKVQKKIVKSQPEENGPSDEQPSEDDLSDEELEGSDLSDVEPAESDEVISEEEEDYTSDDDEE